MKIIARTLQIQFFALFSVQIFSFNRNYVLILTKIENYQKDLFWFDTGPQWRTARTRPRRPCPQQPVVKTRCIGTSTNPTNNSSLKLTKWRICTYSTTPGQSLKSTSSTFVSLYREGSLSCTSI